MPDGRRRRSAAESALPLSQGEVVFFTFFSPLLLLWDERVHRDTHTLHTQTRYIHTHTSLYRCEGPTYLHSLPIHLSCDSGMQRDGEVEAGLGGLPPQHPTLDHESPLSHLVAKLQAENRILQLQLAEKKILECAPAESESTALEGEDDGGLDTGSMDAVQLQLFSLRQQLRRERRCRAFLQKTLAQEVRVMRVWMEHDRIRHREQLLRLSSKVDKCLANSPSSRTPEPALALTPSTVDLAPPEGPDALTADLDEPLADDTTRDDLPPPPAGVVTAGDAPLYYYKFSAPVTSESEGQTRAIIEQTASRSESRRKHLAALRGEGRQRTASNPPKGIEGSKGIRLRGSCTQGRPADVGLPTPPMSFVNPNQIGEEIREDKKTKAWYLRHALTLAFLKVMPASAPSPEPASPGGRPSASLAGGKTISAFTGVKSSSMQRAINEVTHLQFRLSGNAAVPTPSSRSHALPRLEEENNDPDLLQAFDVAAAPAPATSDEDFNEASFTRRHARTNSMSVASSSTDYREDELRISFHAPVIFNQIREFLQLPMDLFRQAVQLSTWRESLSPGKSGTSLIYFGDYVMKSLPDADYAMLTSRYLPAYVTYSEQHPQSLLTRFYAIISVKWLKNGNTKCYVLMQNVFTTRNYIHRIYDVKGSSDNDLPEQLLICGPKQRAVLLRQLRLDLQFLEALSIVDYSMMIGVRSRVLSRDKCESLLANAARSPEREEDVSCLHRCDGGLLSLPIRNEDDTAREEVYYLGVIDVLQEYNSSKKLENFAKGFYNDRTQISVIPPPEYAERLYRSIERISR
eukprot:gene5605-4027_t